MTIINPACWLPVNIDSSVTEKFTGKYKLSDPVLWCKEVELTRKGDRLFLHQTDIDIADFPVRFEFKPASAQTFFNEDWLMELEFVTDMNGNMRQAFLLDGGTKIEMKKIK